MKGILFTSVKPTIMKQPHIINRTATIFWSLMNTALKVFKVLQLPIGHFKELRYSMVLEQPWDSGQRDIDIC